MKKCLLQSHACFVYGVVLMPAIAFAEDDAKKSITLGASALRVFRKTTSGLATTSSPATATAVLR